MFYFSINPGDTLLSYKFNSALNNYYMFSGFALIFRGKIIFSNETSLFKFPNILDERNERA